jgi:hypothetical protein
MRGRRDRHVWGATASIVAVLALATGCVGPSSSAAVAGETPSALPAARELAGTWHGSYWQLGMVYYADDADCTLQIKDDATFTATCKRVTWGTNNLARPSGWSGRVATKGNRLILEDHGGPWPWIVLTRSSNGMLYGVTLDPLVQATIEMEFEREPNTACGAGRS